MRGIELAARFSYITNSLDFCGPQHASKTFLHFLEYKNNQDKVEQALRKFEGLYPYLHALAQKHNKHFLDDEVVEAYWIGNKLLDDFTTKDMIQIIRHLEKRGLPCSFAKKLITNIPDGLVPHHNVNVMYVGVGMTTGSVETTTQNMDNCRTSWGKVLEVHKDTLLIKTQALIRQANKLVLKHEVIKTAVYHPSFLQDIHAGDVVGLHWGFAATLLNSNQLRQLQQYTQNILSMVNKQNYSSSSA